MHLRTKFTLPRHPRYDLVTGCGGHNLRISLGAVQETRSMALFLSKMRLDNEKGTYGVQLAGLEAGGWWDAARICNHGSYKPEVRKLQKTTPMSQLPTDTR